MPIIHPTALVDPSATLSEDVEIGPWAIVGPQVVLGPECRVLARATIEGRVVMGKGNTVGIGAVIGAEPQDFSFKPGTESGVVIGEDNTFREYVTIHRGTAEGSNTIVGNGNFLMAGAHMGHNSSVGNKVIIANNCLLAGHVEVQDGAVLGGGSVFHQFIRVGRLCMVRGGERFNKDVPPFVSAYGTSLVAGINAVGLKRAGFSPEARMEIKKAFRLVYHSGLNISQAIEEAENLTWGPEARFFLDFIATAKRRGVSTVARRGSVSSPDEE